MIWNKCSEKLPIQQPQGWPTYDWVIVTAERLGTNEPWPFAIARYTKDGWDFWESSLPYCPCFGETSDAIHCDEVTHWMEIKQPNKME